MEVIVKLIERNNLVSDDKCSNKHAVASGIASQRVISEFLTSTSVLQCA